jgi:hypothetical protein
MIAGHIFRTTIADMLAKKEKIQAVKAVKDFYGIGLKEGKDLVDSIISNVPYELICADTDRVFDHYESTNTPMSAPISRPSKPSGDVEKLAEALAALVWDKLEDKIEQTITESVGWDIQQVRNDLSMVIQEVQIITQLADTVLQEVKDLAHGQ